MELLNRVLLVIFPSAWPRKRLNHCTGYFYPAWVVANPAGKMFGPLSSREWATQLAHSGFVCLIKWKLTRRNSSHVTHKQTFCLASTEYQFRTRDSSISRLREHKFSRQMERLISYYTESACAHFVYTLKSFKSASWLCSCFATGVLLRIHFTAKEWGLPVQHGPVGTCLRSPEVYDRFAPPRSPPPAPPAPLPSCHLPPLCPPPPPLQSASLPGPPWAQTERGNVSVIQRCLKVKKHQAS